MKLLVVGSGKLMKWQVDKITGWKNGYLMKLRVDETNSS
jgi:hypothetical protein